MTTPDQTPTPAQGLELFADNIEAHRRKELARTALNVAYPDSAPFDDDAFVGARRRFDEAADHAIKVSQQALALDPTTLRAQAIEQEGVEAGLQGCVGTHNPYFFADEAKREAWERGNKRVRDLLERSYPYQAAALVGARAEVWVFSGKEAQLIAIQGRSTAEMWDDLEEWLFTEGAPELPEALYIVPIELETGPDGDSQTYYLNWEQASSQGSQL